MGLGKIAHKFASDLQLSNEAILYGVASRSNDKAAIFGKTFNATMVYDSYEQLASDPEIDVIYIATPHVFHYEHTLLCLNNNKNVLCEKPLGMNKKEVLAMQNTAQSKHLFLMQGLWTRFIPATEKLLQLLSAHVIGDLIFMKADFGFKGNTNPAERIYNKNLGGGSLLDIGIYPLYLSLITLGYPTTIKAMARKSDTGVDTFCSILLDYQNREKAMLESTIEINTPTEAVIYGKKGIIKLHTRFHHSEKISLYQNGELKEVFDIKYRGEGYIHEIEEVNNCLQNNQLESQKLSHKLNLQLITLLDEVRYKIGLHYPLSDITDDN